jgi:hypothetical protein
MIIDRTHRAWLIGSLIALGAGGLFYVPYSYLSVRGVSGGSTVGLFYAGVGSAMMLFAGLLGARKQFRIWRVGRATWWMRAHLWIGTLSFPFILFHAGFRFGGGALTRVLMALFVIVFVSGLAGAALQHFMPKVVTRNVPMETIYDQIDRILEQLVQEASVLISEISADIEQEIEREIEQEAEELIPVAENVKKSGTATLPDERVSKKITTFFETQMQPYITSRHAHKHLLANPVQSATAFQQMRVLVPHRLWPKFDDLENICEEKRELERQRRLHKILHGWLLFHIPASYAVLLLGAIHAVVAVQY